VCLGTDGGCTNNRQSVFEEMRMAALLAKARAADGSVLGAEETFLMGTARGGQALGLPVGRIAADHAADLVVVDLNHPSVQPRATAPQQIVYSMQPDAIARVLVGGRPVFEQGRLTGVDESDIVRRVAEITKDWSTPQDALIGGH
jgi:5-methylthioadenosine/S-adenosylhomocysteine deaminase